MFCSASLLFPNQDPCCSHWSYLLNKFRQGLGIFCEGRVDSASDARPYNWLETPLTRDVKALNECCGFAQREFADSDSAPLTRGCSVDFDSFEENEHFSPKSWNLEIKAADLSSCQDFCLYWQRREQKAEFTLYTVFYLTIKHRWAWQELECSHSNIQN